MEALYSVCFEDGCVDETGNLWYRSTDALESWGIGLAVLLRQSKNHGVAGVKDAKNFGAMFYHEAERTILEKVIRAAPSDRQQREGIPQPLLNWSEFHSEILLFVPDLLVTLKSQKCIVIAIKNHAFWIGWFFFRLLHDLGFSFWPRTVRAQASVRSSGRQFSAFPKSPKTQIRIVMLVAI